MTKSLLVNGLPGTLVNGNFGNLSTTGSGVEGDHAVLAGADLTISRLGMSILSGGSGTNTLRTRKNGVNGSLAVVTSAPSAGFFENTTDTQVLASTDEWCLSYGDTGTDTVAAFIRAIVEPDDSGLLLAPVWVRGTLLLGTASTVYYCGVAGISTPSVAVGAQAQSQWKNEGFTSITGLRVRVGNNTRTTNTSLQLEVNGSLVGSAITIASTDATVSKSVVVNVPLVPGDLVCVRITTGSGTGSTTIQSITTTFRSEGGEQDIFSQAVSAKAFLNNAKYYPLGGLNTDAAAASAALVRVPMGLDGMVKSMRCYVASNSTTVDTTLSLLKNGSPVAVITIASTDTAKWMELTGLNISFTETDDFSYELLGGSSGSLTLRSMGITILSGATLVPADGESEGSAVVQGAGASKAASEGDAAGDCVVEGISGSIVQSEGLAEGSCTVEATTSFTETRYAFGDSRGTSVATGAGAVAARAEGVAFGACEVSGQGRQRGWRLTASISGNWEKEEGAL
jgi:hypothetical protein